MEILIILTLLIVADFVATSRDIGGDFPRQFQLAFVAGSSRDSLDHRDNSRDIPTRLAFGGLINAVGAAVGIYNGVRSAKYAKNEEARQRQLYALHQAQINEAMRAQKEFSERQRALLDEQARKERGGPGGVAKYSEQKRDNKTFSLRLTQGLGGLGGE